MAGGAFGGGNGNAATPYLVEDAQDLNAVRNHLNSFFLQTADIDLSVYVDWKPIPDFSSSDPAGANQFTGYYDGGGFKILNLRIRNPRANYGGLFAYVITPFLRPCLENINLVGVDIDVTFNSSMFFGPLCGITGGGIVNCHSSGDIKASSTGNYINGYTGGLVGNVNQGYLRYCSSSVNVSSNQSSGGLIGGGKNLTDCFSTGDVSGVSAGGLMGVSYSETSHKNCYSSGSVSGSLSAGGLVGRAYVYPCILENCFALNPKIKKTLSTAADYYFNDLMGHTEKGVVAKNCYSLDTMVFEL